MTREFSNDYSLIVGTPKSCVEYHLRLSFYQIDSKFETQSIMATFPPVLIRFLTLVDATRVDCGLMRLELIAG